MKQQQTARWLKGVCILISLMGLIFFTIIIPLLVQDYIALHPELSNLFLPSLWIDLFVAVLCFMIVYYFWRVCVEIGKDNSFSKKNADFFIKISHLALILTILWFLLLTISVVNHFFTIGFLLFFILATFISLCVAILAICLSHLIQKAADMQSENELTI